ncbi:hypothetical protein NQ317_019394 [Molorchus minor]|uniref:tRNA (34-2'-O)-methyltransferase regulator WDR6 n=1 Tax=Molorchus minor TaxID=1323400 RepID=A0ABQ9JD97_9CUCU|nr:hypothetical protein NQ317_019394 [Molorchus minor]
MFLFQSEFLNVDVTAAKIHGNYFLVGLGGFIHIFAQKTSKLLHKFKVFDGHNIFGIVVNKTDTQILLYGGKYIKLFEINEVFTYFNEIADTVESDWILDAKFIDDDKEIATVSMHNKVHIWDQNLKLMIEAECDEKCVLYSAHICCDKLRELIILSGTVFSEVLVWKPTQFGKQNVVLKRLKRHNGVIFSVHYNQRSGYICSSSDDRSTVLWKIKSGDLGVELKKRVFRSKVLLNCFITGGEDSLVNIWSFNGQLVRKVETHQGASVWALDSDEENNIILTGGGDCGVTTFPLQLNFQEYNLVLPDKRVPKSVVILANRDLVVLTGNAILYYIRNRQCQEIQTHDDLKSYALLVASPCKRLIALAGFHGQIYIYKEEADELKQIGFQQTKIKSRIFSLHWLNCSTFLICQAEGKMSVLYLKTGSIFHICNFILPPSKERWATSAVCVDNYLIAGDRKGNIHLFEFGKVLAIQTIKKAHSHLGVTNIVTNNNLIKSLGRNGIVKTFVLKMDGLYLLSSEKLPFTWLVDIKDSLLLAFSGDNFVIWNYVSKRIIFEKSCGGGHRSWDFFKHLDTSRFCYIKDKMVCIYDCKLNLFEPVDVIPGYHVREINAVEIIEILNDKFLVISGGEDNTLRLSLVGNGDIKILTALRSHLSSIRTITNFKISSVSHKNEETYLVFSGGGRAQIVCWKLKLITENGSFKNVTCSEQCSYYQPLQYEESEMRIMDMCASKIDNRLCFCILSHNILITMATDGKLVFWDVTNIFKKNGMNKAHPFHVIKSHQSGINSSALKMITNDLCLIATGGDDNAIILNLVRFYLTNGLMKIENLNSFTDVCTHCTQITGIYIADKYLISASIGQRVAVFEWHVVGETNIICKYITKYNTSVADLQGLKCFQSHDIDAIVVYGKGIEYIKIKRNYEQ